MKDKIHSIVNSQEKLIENFIEKKRPPKELRGQIDLGFTFKDQVLEIFEIRPLWNKQEDIIQSPIAKCRYVKSKNLWKIYWMRANGKSMNHIPKKEKY